MIVFFFKQKTSYEMRISDWSSDVCSSDLLLGTLRAHARKIRPNGRLFYAVPNRDFTFDRHRPVTPFEHLVQDDREGPEQSRAQHYMDRSEETRVGNGCGSTWRFRGSPYA